MVYQLAWSVGGRFELDYRVDVELGVIHIAVAMNIVLAKYETKRKNDSEKMAKGPQNTTLGEEEVT